ncbi:MAG: tRNA pseudouridine(55) synthase TruB [Clostridium sp.]|nr:tRNA pseudouridine(55) synthase TruB [Clostridium sp.]
MDGVVNLYKEKGITSFGVVAQVRRILKTKKVGHTGTLDPEAEGVLPICVGRATKLVDYIMAGEKTYRAEFQLGKTSDTLDAFGEVTHHIVTMPKIEQVDKVLLEFLGDSMQTAPMYSALKKDGKKLYELAREGQVIEREPRPITIFKIELISFKGDSGVFRCTSSKGTYIRSIIDDMGQKLGTGAIMTGLVREQSGPFIMENAVTLGNLEREGWKSHFTPMEDVLNSYPEVVIPNDFYHLIVNGVKVKDTRLKDLIPSGLYRAYSEKRDFLGLIERNEEALFLKVNLM